MRRLLASILMLALSVGSQAASNLDVKVQTAAGAPIPSVQVVALSFNNGKPDAVVSRSAFTDASGWASFGGAPLQVGSFYQIFVASQGFRPSLLDQFGGNPPSLTASATLFTSTIVINSGVTGVGEIDVPVTGATASSLIFGQVGLKTGGGASAFGIMATDGAGAGTMKFINVTTVTAQIYQVSVYDPVKDLSAGAPVDSALGPSVLTLPALSLAAVDAKRPVANIGQAQTGGGGGLSVYGVVIDTAAVPIPYLQLNFQSQHQDGYGQTFDDWRGAQSDQNGVFQLYDLRVGSTYYATIYGGCNFTTGLCYQGSQSTAAPNGVPGINDFLYASTTSVLNHRIVLAQMPPSNGAMTVFVKDQYGNPFPQAWIGLYPDGMPWQVKPLPGGPYASCDGAYSSQPGFKSLNVSAPSGSSALTGLPSGNYNINAWTPYGGTSFNAGPDGQQNYSNPCSGANGADDLRVTIDTTSAPGQMAGVYDRFGNIVSSGLPSVTVTVNIPTGTLNGVVQGALTFPSVVDLSASPISIVLYPNCGNSGGPCKGGGFASFSSASTGPVINYAIPVSSGQTYWMQVLSDYWGAVYPGGNQPQPDLKSTSTAVIDLNFFPAGRVTGSMRKPDGSLYVPPTGNSGGAPGVNASGDSAWGHAQVNADGTFSIGGLLPGDYTLGARAEGSSQFPYTTKQPAPRVTAVVNASVSQDIYLADAVTVKPGVNSAFLPPMTIVSCAGNDQGDCPPQTWKTYALPQGTPFTPLTAANLLAGGGDNVPGLFYYSPSTGMVQTNGCWGQFMASAGFCTNSLAASKTGSTYDFYLMRSGSFDSANLDGGARPYFVIESSTKSVIVGPAYATVPTYSSMGSTTMVQGVSVAPAADLSGLQQANLTGTVTAANMINLRQFQSLAGNFNKFLEYLPIVWVYDSAGTLKAAGLVVPFPPNLGKNSALDKQLNQAVASGNFAQFQALTGPVSGGGWGPLGFDIRGLTANTPYNLVVTTPNYPPYKMSVTLGSAGTGTSADVNLDSNAGVAISGVVQSTSAAKIGGAQVTVKASGYGPTTLTTDSSGYWNLSGLGAGRYQVSVVAAGYAQGIQGVDVSGLGSVSVPPFSLRLANATISGTVYTNNPICPAGATCSAFGKTVLQGIPVLAYDDTLNLSDPTAVLPLYRAVTDSSGTYKLTGLSDDLHQYKVFVNAPGYFVLNQSTEAVAGDVVGFDFALKPKPLDIGVFGRPFDGVYEFQITNYKEFSDGSAWVGASPFVMATSTPLSQNDFFERPDADGATQLFLTYSTATLTAGTQYTLHLEAQPNDPRADKVVKEIPFGLGLPHAVCQSVDQALIGDDEGVNSQGIPNNTLPIDIEGGTGGNASGLSMSVGGVIPTLSTAIPSMCMSETDASVSPYATAGIRSRALTQAAFASGVYNVSLSSVNYTAKGVDLTLYYDQSGTSLDDLAVYHYNNATLAWESVPGLQTIDPVKGTISVQGLKSLASVLSVGGPKSAAADQSAAGFLAVSDGRGYRPNTRVAAVTDSGVYAVLRPSQVSGGAYSGTVVKVFNFPNPFNLQTKSVTLNTTGGTCVGGAGLTTTGGTVIKYEIPAGISGQGVIRIYTVAGRLVRELDAGPISPSRCYYTQWDGRNRSGQPVANGVYYGILSVGGSAQTSATFKLAVIK
ncbi:MAG: hypothetical protein A2V88_03455 [Elusimicrobia bacterium RBG_16_66_12]|nr:MAG: hypothetical protein A2V88_03455 [Elusimicrobia bacterium RBG_16_66_12]